jgi:hypothetical protein
MNDQLKLAYLARVKAARSYLPAESLAEQHPVINRASVEDLGTLLYRLTMPGNDHADVTNQLTRWAALHTDALMSVLNSRFEYPERIDTSVQVPPSARIGVAAEVNQVPALLPLPEQAPPLPPAPPPRRADNNEKRAALLANGWTCHSDIEAQNVPQCWENGFKWVTLEEAYDLMTEVPRAPTFDEVAAALIPAPPEPPPPPPPLYPVGYLSVRDMRTLLEGLPGDAPFMCGVDLGNGEATVMSAKYESVGPHGEIVLALR